MGDGATELVLGMLVVLGGKIVWDWLTARRRSQTADGGAVLAGTARELCELRHLGLERDIAAIRETLAATGATLARIDKRLAVLGAVIDFGGEEGGS